MRIAVVTTHPIQNQVPWIRGLAAAPDRSVRVFFGMIPDPAQQGEGFGLPFRWDVPLLDGYAWEVVPNRARRPAPGRFLGIDAPGIESALAGFAPDAAVLCGWHSRFLWQAKRACRRLRVPALVRGDSNALRRRPLWKRWVHARHLRGYAAVLAVGASNAAFYREMGVPASRIRFAPHCVDSAPLLASVPADAARRAQARRRLGVPVDATCFAFVGKLTPSKRPLDLLRAFEEVARDRADVHLLFVGSGEQEESLRRAAASVPARVSFAGFMNQSEIGVAYGCADAIVLPSDFHETWGLVVNEGMACGLPAVVSDRVGCGPDLVREGETGFTFPFGDVCALAGRLRLLASDPEARRRMGRNAAALAATYSPARAVEGTIAGIDAATERAAVGSGR
jgi:glycosyltransferase involved in cell wall biosynthesis